MKFSKHNIKIPLINIWTVLITFLLILAQALGVIDIHPIWLFSPIWIPFALAISIMVSYYVLYYILLGIIHIVEWISKWSVKLKNKNKLK